MGIPRIFQWISKRYPGILQKVKATHIVEAKIDNLYIDANGILHPDAAKVYGYENGNKYKPLLRPRKPIPKKVLKKRHFREVVNTIDGLVRIIQPQKRLVICIDGVAGSAKQSQQRMRRFRSARDRREEDFEKFDSNCLTPGTEYMHHLMKYIDWWCRYMVTFDEVYQKLEIIFSSDKVPGEGEHKIIKYIRSQLTEEERENESHCIHGLDADLFMLSLSTHLQKFYLFREDMFDRHNDFYLVDVGLMRKELINDLKPEDERVTYKEKKLINDFIVICFLVGNDFLPHITCLDIMSGGIDTIIDIYKNNFSELGHITKLRNKGIILNRRSLRAILKTLSELEATMLENRFNLCPPKFEDKTMTRSMKKPSIGDPDQNYKIDEKVWRKTYYQRKFGLDSDKDKEKIEEISRHYIIGLQWVATYYSIGIPSWTWYYPYHYPPLPRDIWKVMRKFKPDPFEETKPLSPFEQLLSVLPPKSRGLLPDCFEHLFIKEDSSLFDLYPTEFEIDQEGCKADWEGMALLPFVDSKRIQKAYQQIEKKNKESCPRHFSRNYIGLTTSYKYIPQVQYPYRSYYGNIEECHTKTTNLQL
jgi:5'-3' exoribonuclease 1